MKTNLLIISLLLWFGSVNLQSCEEKDTLPEIAQIEANEELSGGTLTTFDKSENAFGNQAAGLSSDESDFFVIGNSFF